jgi:DNA-binding beta-propeller fold protein YncE
VSRRSLAHRVCRWALVAPRASIGCLLVCGALASSLAAGSAAASETKFGFSGEDAGQFNNPSGVAVDQASGDLYVADAGNQRIEELQGSGGFQRVWGLGVVDGKPVPETCTASPCYRGQAGSGSGSFETPTAVAVDNDPLSLSYGDVYVVEYSSHRVEKFNATGAFLLMFGGEVNETKDNEAGASEAEKNLCTAASGDTCKAGRVGAGNGQFSYFSGGANIAVGSTGTVYVGDANAGNENRVQEFGEGGEYLSQLALAGSGRVRTLAVDGSGDLYVKGEASGGIRKYNPTGTLLETLDAAGEPEAVALDPAGDVFIMDGAGGFHVLKYSSAGVELASFGRGTANNSHGIAFGETTGELYATSTGEVDTGVWALTQPGPGPLMELGSEQAGEIQPTSVKLAAEINPEGAETTYHFEYGTSEGYGSSTAQSSSIGSGFADGPASASLSGLTPATTYHYRVVAKSAAGTAFGPDREFTTLPPVSIDGESTVAVAGTSATLQAQIDPLGSDTTYRFEYGPSASYGASVPSPAVDIGSGASDVGVAIHLQGLVLNTVYHYRVVASNVLGTADGPDETFITQTAGGELTLADGRQWEMVSPPVKEGGRLLPIAESGIIQAAADGGAITYLAAAPTEANPAGSATETQVFSVRGADGGWSSQDIQAPHERAPEVTAGNGEEYRFFSSDLSLGVIEPRGKGEEPTLSAKATERTPYLRDDAPLQPGAGEQAFYHEAEEEAPPGSPVGYLPLITSANVPPGVKFGAEWPSGVKFVGGTSDLSHVVLSSPVPLTAKAGAGGLYEWSGGQLLPVSVLPGAGEEFVSGGLGGQFGLNARNAISADGARVFWTQEGHLYLRDTAAGVTVQLDAAQGAPEPSAGQAEFQFASGDGSRVYFTDNRRLTPDVMTGGQDLFECEVVEGVVGKPTCKLSDLTLDPNAGERAAVQSSVGASEDGSYVYLVADGAIAKGATTGDCGFGSIAPDEQTCNLYVMHYSGGAWTTKFITKLSGDDAPDWVSSSLSGQTARVSPDGRYLAFMSDRSLTGYDNNDANSGKPDEEVYLYDATAGHLVCASCNPSGARPVGLEANQEQFIDADRVWEGHNWLAADVPGWTAMQVDEARYQSRYLSNSGRLFFNGVDALVPQAANGVADVYEYEPAGIGSCASSSVAFSEASGGCLALISAASSGEESVFLDASENGDDVFLMTTARLAGQDLDNAYDVYDAHVCSAASPCAPVTVPSPACTTADSCRTAPSPQPGVFGAPASATFSGAGNLAPPPAVAGEPAKKQKKSKIKSKRPRKKRKAKRRRKAKGGASARGRGSVSVQRSRKSSSSSRTGR